MTDGAVLMQSHRQGAALFCGLCLFLSPARADEGQPYDLVLRGGKIVDGSGNPWYFGDVALRGDRIAALGQIPAGAGRRELIASSATPSQERLWKC